MNPNSQMMEVIKEKDKVIKQKNQLLKEKDKVIKQKDKVIKEKTIMDEKLDHFMDQIIYLLEKDFELSDEAKKDVEEARKTPLSEYVSQRDAEKELLG